MAFDPAPASATLGRALATGVAGAEGATAVGTDAAAIAGGGSLGRRRSLTAWRRLDEAALVRAARRGSEDAIGELFRRHWGDLHRAALLITGDRAAAEDIAQEAFLAALRALDRFDVRRPLRPWLHRIAANRAIDFSRARALRGEVADAVPDRADPRGEDGAALAVDEELAAALLGLGIEQRAVVVLRYVLDLTPGEIAAALDLPRGTVNSRLRRGLDALGDALGEAPA